MATSWRSCDGYRALLSKQRNDYKAWLRANAPQARVTGEFDISLNAVAVQLNGATLAQVSATSMVKLAQYEGLYYPNAVDPDLALIQRRRRPGRAMAARPTAGAGVKVAIVDSGIDVTHPCFSDTGYATQTADGDPQLHQQQGHRGQGLQQQDAVTAATRPKPSTRTARTWPARWRATTRRRPSSTA